VGRLAGIGGDDVNLFDIPETPLPPLEAARKRLAKAIEAEREAEQADRNRDNGPEPCPALEYARQQRIVTEQVVAALERKTIKGANL